MRKLSLAVVLALVLLSAIVWAQSQVFTVTPVCCTAWTVNNQSSPTLAFVRGQTYTFNVNAPGHPFYIKTVAGVTGTADTWDEGVTNNGVMTGALTFTVPTDAPATLFYQCGVHTAMTGTIQVVSPPAVPAAGVYGSGLLALAIGGVGLMAVRRRRTGAERP
jgi:hypothetical protein